LDLEVIYSNFPGGCVQDDLKATIEDKEKRKLYFLMQEEETWRQKSRVRWLTTGDSNTKFFHAFANSRKQNNTIWDITKEDGTFINKTIYLQKEVVSYFLECI
jgi:hypothetical protein